MAKKLPKEPQVREDEEVATTTSSTSSTNSQLPSWKDKPNAREADDSTYNAYANALSTAQNSNTATTLPPTTSETATKQSILQTPSVREDEKQAEQIAYNNALSSPTTSENATKTDILQKPITREDTAPSHETTEETPAAQTDNPVVNNIQNTNAEYQKQLSNLGVNPWKTETTEEDYYNLLKSESYKALLDSEIQASAARDQATKYLNASLAANGFANQGLAESSRLGVQNNYMQALASAQNNYNTNLNSIAQQQYAAQQQQATDNFESATTLMSQATDEEMLTNVLANYGVTADENGNLSGGMFDTLDQNSKAQMQTLYNMYAKELETAQEEEGYITNNNVSEIDVTTSQGKTVNLEKDYPKMWERYQKSVSDNYIENGWVVAFQSSDKDAALFMYQDGKLIPLTNAEYNELDGDTTVVAYRNGLYGSATNTTSSVKAYKNWTK